jgi:hypothetical protein
MAYDPAIGKLVLFGGVTQAANGGDRIFLNDTWTYDGKTWTKQSPTASPPARTGAAMAYDPNIGKLVLFGASEPVAADTWTYDGKTWIQDHPATSPAKWSYGVFAPDGLSMAYDPAIGKLVLVGGEGTWTYDKTTWTKRSPGLGVYGPVTSYLVGPVTYDAALNKLVVYGKMLVNYGGWTWTYDGKTWTKQSAPPGPGLTDGWSLAYDPAVGHTVLFGGVSFDPTDRTGFGWQVNETWTYDGKTWTKQSPPTAPTPRFDASMAYDPALNSLVLFGGESGFSGPFTETWTYGPY